MHSRPEPRIAPLPPIPAKRYFMIGEVSELCDVKPHVLRYWEQEFTQLRPMKRSGNRRYYQHHEVLLVRRIRELLYEQGFTINGARNRLGEILRNGRSRGGAAAQPTPEPLPTIEEGLDGFDLEAAEEASSLDARTLAAVRADLMDALELLR